MDKPTAILVPGPRYLFGTTGIYYLRQLTRHYRVAVVVDASYRDDASAREAFSWPDVEAVELRNATSPMEQQFGYRDVLGGLVQRLKPALLIQHNFVYLTNQYLRREVAAQGLDCRSIAFLNTMGLPMVEDCRPRLAAWVEETRRSAQVSRLQAELMVRQRTSRQMLVDQFLLPKLSSGRCLPPSINHVTGDILDPKAGGAIDRFLLYQQVEAEATVAEWPGLADITTIIRHPMEVVGDEVHRAIGAPEEEAQIVVLPGCEGYVTERCLTQPADQVVRAAADTWAAALRLLADRFPGHRILWKLHPALGSQAIMIALSQAIADRVPNFHVVPYQDSAQRLMLQSRVVVSEASGILWWSSFFASKTVFSLDIFGSRNDFFKRCDGVRYFDSLAALEAADLSLGAVENRERLARRQALPTLSDIVTG